MTAFVVLLRAVNVGGTGRLSMPDLAAVGEAAGFARVRTYIASGNLVLASGLDEAGVKAAIETRLAAHAGTPIRVVVRTAGEMAAVLASNPFAGADPSRTVAIFLDGAPPADALDHAKHRTSERLALGIREVYVAYGDAMARSRLVVPAAKPGTARNMKTVARLAEMAAET